MLVVDCGYATAKDDHTYWNKSCGPTGFPCPATPGNATPHQFLTTTALDGTTVPIAQWCAGVNTPMPSTAALRDEIIRLLKPPPIGVSPGTGTGLVNLKTLYWVNTDTIVNLGRSALVGLPVELRVGYLRTDFDFGDGATGTLESTPGKPYDPANDCGRCTAEFGHSYQQPETVTVTAHTYWQAQYRVAGQQWNTIPGAVTANRASTATLTILAARSTLVSR